MRGRGRVPRDGAARRRSAARGAGVHPLRDVVHVGDVRPFLRVRADAHVHQLPQLQGQKHGQPVSHARRTKPQQLGLRGEITLSDKLLFVNLIS